MLQYLYKNWAQAGMLIAIYVTLVLLCMAPQLDTYLLLIWLQFPVYLVHEFEEHAYPGGFKNFINKMVFHIQDQDIPLTDKRVFWINILAVWVLFPLTAVATQYIDPALGILTPCFSLLNASLHIINGVGRRLYNPGILISIFLNYPIGLYTLYLAHTKGYLLYSYLAFAVLFSLAVHLAMGFMAFYWYRIGIKNKAL